MYVYIYVYMYIRIYIYIYMYRERERERDTHILHLHRACACHACVAYFTCRHMHNVVHTWKAQSQNQRQHDDIDHERSVDNSTSQAIDSH